MKRTITIHSCDRCDKEFNSPREVGLEISMGSRHSHRNEPVGNKELCQKCTDEFLRFLKWPKELREMPHGVRCHALQPGDPYVVDDDSEHSHTHHFHTGAISSAGSHSHSITPGQGPMTTDDQHLKRANDTAMQTATFTAIAGGQQRQRLVI